MALPAGYSSSSRTFGAGREAWHLHTQRMGTIVRITEGKSKY